MFIHLLIRSCRRVESGFVLYRFPTLQIQRFDDVEGQYCPQLLVSPDLFSYSSISWLFSPREEKNLYFYFPFLSSKQLHGGLDWTVLSCCMVNLRFSFRTDDLHILLKYPLILWRLLSRFYYENLPQSMASPLHSHHASKLVWGFSNTVNKWFNSKWPHLYKVECIIPGCFWCHPYVFLCCMHLSAAAPPNVFIKGIQSITMEK